MMKQRKSTLITYKLFRIMFLSLFLLPLSQQIQAQSVSITSQFPTQSLNVGTNNYEGFSTKITNIGSDTLSISNIALKLPTGVTLDPSSVTVTQNGVPILFTPPTDNQNIVLNNDSLPFGSAITVTYNAQAGCLAIPNNAGNTYAVNVSNETDVSFVDDKTLPKGSNPPPTQNTSSNTGYSITFPNISVNTTTIKPVLWQSNYTDNIQVTNGVGAGSVNSMLFIMKLNDATILSNISFTITGPSGTPIPVTNATISNGDARFPIDATLLSKIGFNSNTLGSGGTFSVQPSFTVSKYSADVGANYSIQLYSNGQACTNLVNASGIVDYTQEISDASVSIARTILQLANWCTQNFIANYVITNTSTGNIASDDLLNNSLTINPFNCSVQSVNLLNSDGTQTPILVAADNYWYFPASVPDLKPNQSVTIQIIAQPDLSSDLSKLTPSLGVTIHSEKIDNKTITQQNQVGGGLMNIYQPYVTYPTDSKVNQLITYVVNYDVMDGNLAGMNGGFLDLQNPVVVYNNKEYQGSTIFAGQQVLGPTTIQVPATCPMPQEFDVAIYTNNCPTRAVMTSANANTIVQCPSTGTGSCYSVLTDTVMLGINSVMNTCQQIPLTATGTVSHWCDSAMKCPRFTQVVARVYDLSGNLTFNDQNNSTLNVDGITTNLTLNPSYATNNGLAWVGNISPLCALGQTNTDNLTLNALFQIQGNKNLPNISNVNLRVEFALLDANGTLYRNDLTYGTGITVYNPQPSFFTTQTNIVPCFVIQTYNLISPYAPNAPSVPINVTEIDYQAAPGFSYSSSTNPVNKEEVDYNPAFVSGIYNKAAYAKCVVDGSIVNIPIEIYYTDEYANATCDNSIVYNADAGISYYAKMPTINIQSSTIEQNLKKVTTWQLEVANNGSADASHVILQIQPDASNQITLQIQASLITIDGNPVTSSQYDIEGNVIYLDLGSIPASGEAIVTIPAQASNCSNQGNSFINIKGTWSCDALTSSNYANFDYDCNNISTQLQLENMEADLHMVQTNLSNTTYSLCDTIPINVTVSNIGRAELSRLGFWFDNPLPNNVTLVGNKITATYHGVSTDLINDKSMYINDTILTNPILKDVRPIAGNLHIKDSIQLSFNVQYQCMPGTTNGLTSIEPFSFYSRALSNCGDTQNVQIPFNPPIKGFDGIDNLQVSANANAFTTPVGGSGDHSTLSASVLNTTSQTINSASMTVVLPDGVQYNGYTAMPGTSISSATFSGNSITFNFTNGLPSGTQVGAILNIQETQTCPKTSSYAQVYVSLIRSILGCDKKSSCLSQKNTQETQAQIKQVQSPFNVYITVPSVICNNSVLTASAANSYLWSTQSTGNTALVTQPTTVYSVTAYSAQGCVGTASATVTFNPIPTVTVGLSKPSPLCLTDWISSGTSLFTADPQDGSWSQSTAPPSGCVGNYTYTYTYTDICSNTTSQQLSFVVQNCCPAKPYYDLDGDGTVTTNDALLLMNYLNNLPALVQQADCSFLLTVPAPIPPPYCPTKLLPTTVKLNSCFLNNADLNNSGGIDQNDVNMILQKLGQ